MAANKNKIDRIHDQLPRHFKTRQNPNWNTLVGALGESDQKLADLIEEVRKQFFVKTANRPYIDRLGSNFKVSRPRFVGMQDTDFRRYIPVLAYQPKQVKLVMDSLLDIFFFKETTTSFSQSDAAGPFYLKSDWELVYTVDGTDEERIIFSSADFTDIANAQPEEVVGAINRQAKKSFAIIFDDRIKKQQYIRLFTNTIGAKGSIRIDGGLANLSLQFKGFNHEAGASVSTSWDIDKIGGTTIFTHTGGPTPNLNKINIGDKVIIDIPGNEGSFVIESIDLFNSSFTFTNLFSTPGSHTHDASSNLKFFNPLNMVIYKNDARSIVWEVEPGQIIIEMPASPPVVKRSLIGSAHLNGLSQKIESINSPSSLSIEDASKWPLNGGYFILQEKSEVISHIETISEDIVLNKTFNTTFDNKNLYQYTSKSGNTLSGISPDLPETASIHEQNIASATRTGSTLTIITTTPNDFKVGEGFAVYGSGPDNTMNNSFIIKDIINNTTFICDSLGPAGVNTGGTVKVERIGIAGSGSLIHLNTSQVDTGIYGPYMWDPEAAFVLSSSTAAIQEEVRAGNNIRTLQVSTNNIENEESYAIFDFGTENQEGPVRILYKASDNVLQLDPAYTFKQNHQVGSSITVIRKKGAIVMQGLGKERAGYITDPAVARELLKDLMKQVKSVGIFIEFLIRFPEQIYSTLDVYYSDNKELWQIGQQ